MAETKISVSSHAVALMGQVENRLSEVVAYSVLSGTSLTTGILNESIGGMGIKARHIHQYAMTKYSLGLPGGITGEAQQASHEAVADAISANLGISGVIIEWAFLTNLGGQIAVFPYLLANRGYNIQNNSISIHSFPLSSTSLSPVQVSNVTFSGSEAIIEYSHTYTYTYSGDGGETTIETEYFQETTTSFNPAYINGGKFIAAKYNTGGGDSYWFYNTADGTYPDLATALIGFGEDAFMPVVPLRHDNVDLTTIDDELYRTSKQLLNYIKINIDELAESINDNPDIAQIDHAWVMFGISVNTEDIPSLRYLELFFNYLHGVQEFTSLDFNNAVVEGTIPPQTVIKIDKNRITRSPVNEVPAVTILEHGLNIEVSFNYISTETEPGEIGNIGFTTKEIIYDYTAAPGEPIEPDYEIPDPVSGYETDFHHTQTDGPDGGKSLIMCPGQYMNFDSVTCAGVNIPFHEYDEGRETYWNMTQAPAGDIVAVKNGKVYTYPANDTFNWGSCSGEYGGDPAASEDQDYSRLILKTQLTKTLVRTTTVRGLKHTNYVYKDKVYITTLHDYEEEPDNGNLIIPVHFGIVNQLPLLVQNDIYTNSLYLIVNAIEKTKVKWYASKVFRIIIMFIAVAITAYSGQGWTTAIANKLAEGAVAIFWAMVKTVAIAAALSVAFKYVVEFIGPEAGFIIGAIIVVYGMLQGNIKSLASLAGSMPTAQQLLHIGNALISAANRYVKGELADFYKEVKSFEDEVKEKMELLEDETDLLDMQSNYNPLNFLSKQTMINVPFETPDDFYNRTIHTGNIGTKVLDVISVYHDIMLKLPEAEYN